MRNPHRRTNFSLINTCLVPMHFIWMGPMVHTTRTGLVKDWGGKFSTGWMVEICPWWYCNSRITGSTFVKKFHEGTHSGQTTLKTILAQYFYVPKLSSISKTVCEKCSSCVLCAKNNPWQRPRAPSKVQSVGGIPFKNLIVDFTEMPWVRGCKYLLVFVCIFSGWVKVFPTWTEKV
jgi:hypothetical protein